MTAKTTKAVSTRVWYIFIDVVEFTGQGRSMDDMVAIITALNDIVKRILSTHGITSRKVVTLATGDGMCLGLLNSSAYTQTRIAFDIREAVNAWSEGQSMPKLRYKLRTALNIYNDYKIKDINNKQNLIGHGINTTARILGLCEPGEIVVSSHMHSGLEKDGQFMDAFSPESCVEVKGEDYCFRRIELNNADRIWKNGSTKETSKTVPRKERPEQPVESTSKIGHTKANAWEHPILLINEPFDESLIEDNRKRHVAIQDAIWQPFAEEPKPRAWDPNRSYSNEIRLKSAFRSFCALVSPNSESFKLVMKLMNSSGKLPNHMVYGEVSFTLQNKVGSSGMELGFWEAGIPSERSLTENPRPRFEVKLLVRPIRTNKFQAAQLYINGGLVQTKLIPKEFTARFGIVVSGNGKPCHMGLSEISVYTVAK